MSVEVISIQIYNYQENVPHTSFWLHPSSLLQDPDISGVVSQVRFISHSTSGPELLFYNANDILKKPPHLSGNTLRYKGIKPHLNKLNASHFSFPLAGALRCHKVLKPPPNLSTWQSQLIIGKMFYIWRICTNM